MDLQLSYSRPICWQAKHFANSRFGLAFARLVSNIWINILNESMNDSPWNKFTYVEIMRFSPWTPRYSTRHQTSLVFSIGPLAVSCGGVLKATDKLHSTGRETNISMLCNRLLHCLYTFIYTSKTMRILLAYTLHIWAWLYDDTSALSISWACRHKLYQRKTSLLRH